MNERLIWELLKSKGIPPERGALSFTGGLGPVLSTLRDYYLTDLIPNTDGSFDKLVVGQYGGGKTHFLRAVQEIAGEEGYVTSYVALSGIEDYHELSSLVTRIFGEIRLPLSDETKGGAFALLDGAVEKKRRIFEQSGMPDPDAGLEQWVKQVRFQAWPHPEYGKVLYRVIGALLEENTDLVEVGIEWLEGIKLPADRRKVLGASAVSGQANLRRHGLQLIMSLVAFVKECGFTGTCLLLDEAENAFNVKGKAKEKALGTLRNLGDNFSTREAKRTFMLTAVTKEVEESFVDYMALQQRYARIAGPFSAENRSSPVIDLGELPYDNLRVLIEIGEKLLDLANRIYPETLRTEIELQNLERLANYAESRSFDVNHRRLFVKTATWLLDNNMQNKNSRIWSEEELGKVYEGQLKEILDDDHPEETFAD